MNNLSYVILKEHFSIHSSFKGRNFRSTSVSQFFLAQLQTFNLVLFEIFERANLKKKQTKKATLHLLIFAFQCEYKRGSLLNHPLIMSLIYEKWGRFGRLVFYSKFVLYFIFLIFLTGYVLAAVPLFPRRSHDLNNTCESRASTYDKNKAHVIIFIRAGRWVVIILGGLQLIFEVETSFCYYYHYYGHFIVSS